DVGHLLTVIFVVTCLVFMYLLIVGILIYDIIMNRDVIRQGKWRELFFYSDPFYFRIEFIITSILLALILIGAIILNIVIPREYHFIKELCSNTLILIYFCTQLGFSLGITLY